MSDREARGDALAIQLTIETTAPLTGTATTAAGRAIHFDGWLALLSVISELIDGTQAAVDPGRRRATTSREGVD